MPRAAANKSLQSCPTLCNSIDGSPPGSPVPGILQARTLEWVAIPSPMHESENESEVAQCCLAPWSTAYQAPLSMGFSRQEYWSGVPLPSPQCRVGLRKSAYQMWRGIEGSLVTLGEVLVKDSLG